MIEARSLRSRADMSPDSIHDLVRCATTRQEIVVALRRLIESEIREARGTKGVAMRRAYGHATRRRPDLTDRLVASLLDDWLDACAPDHVFPGASAPMGTLTRYIEAHREDLGDRLLLVIERRLERSRNRWAQLIRRMLPRRAIRDALPRIGLVVERALSPRLRVTPV